MAAVVTVPEGCARADPSAPGPLGGCSRVWLALPRSGVRSYKYGGTRPTVGERAEFNVIPWHPLPTHC
jgi:hypothetical protein